MRASLRWTIMLLAWGTFLTPSVTLAQSAPDPQAKAPPTAAVGPTELQNFSLPGSGPKPTDQTPAAPPAAPQPSSQASEPSLSATAIPAPVRHRPEPHRLAQATKKQSSTPASAIPKTPAPATTVAPQPKSAAQVSIAPQAAEPRISSPPPSPVAAATAEPSISLLPWLAAAIALLAGTLFLFMRRRSRLAYAGDAEFDMFVPPEPVAPPLPPAPPPVTRSVQPEPVVPAPAPRPPRGGIVSSRLRPSLEITVQPLRCLVEGDRVLLDFELELFNAGSAPARAVQAEAGLLNAGGGHEQELAAFFTRPAADGQSIDAIAPMKRMSFTSQVIAPRDALPDYELGGRKAIVPVLAFNALYQWSGGKAQTSAAYLVGRETRSEKLGPLVSDGPNREFRGLAAHLLPTSLRT